MSAIDTIDFSDTQVAFQNKSDKQLKETYFIFWLMNINWLTKIGTFFIKIFLKLGLPIKSIIKSTLFKQFCGGEDIQETLDRIKALNFAGVGAILDYSVEGEDSEVDFEKTCQEILKTIEVAAGNAKEIPFAVFKITGIGSAILLEKVQKNQDILSHEDSLAYERILGRIYKLSQRAKELNVRLLIDAEESWIQDVIDDIVLNLMSSINKEQVLIYNTYQLYRSDVLSILKTHHQLGREKGYKVGAKLVRGAYMEKERILAKENEYQSPIHSSKEATDLDFNEGLSYCIENIRDFALVLGTHNEFSTNLCMNMMAEKQILPSDDRVYFAQLLGMSDNISYGLAKNGYHVAKYVPYGPVEAVMPYLIRRAAENSSIAGQSSREFTLLKKEIRRRKKTN